jgi:predicted nucleotide-binding protein
MSHRVFIASSSEGLPVAETVQALLRKRLGDLGEVLIWNQETFEPTKTYIESIEQELDKVDFAVLVLMEDDKQLYRKTKAFVPRDNVVFELGLFIAKLGRERSFYIQPPGVKLPTDLLGIESLKFKLPERSAGKAPVSARRNFLSASGDERDALRAALRPACSKIVAAIVKVIKNEPSRQKLTNIERAVQKERRLFYDRIQGAWWERIRSNGKVQALSFFTVMADEVYNSVRVEGEAYGKDGALRAKWRSAGARLEDRRILYFRECSHFSPGMKPHWLTGVAVFDFDPGDSSGRIEKGSGSFWEGDETHPEKTIVKSVELRRVRNERHKSVMQEGNERAKETLVRLVLDNKQSPVF